MKTKIYIKTAIFTLMGGLVLLSSSCLKDSRYVNYFADAPLAEFPLAEVNAYQPGGSDGAYQSINYPTTNTNDTITVAVKVAAPRALTSATTFTISTTDVTALNSYNTANAGGTFVPLLALPASDFTVIGGLQVTVPANITEVYFKVVVNGAFVAANPKGTYVLPLTIENAGSVQIAIPEKYLLYNLFAQ
jgi:hypothetical protein